MIDNNKKLGVALVGLGRYSEGQLAPALKLTEHCRLTSVVSGSDKKITRWMSEHGLAAANTYRYDNFDSIAGDPDVDIVYVVLPNALHAEYVIRAAKAGKHVIVEKPMATSVNDARRMVQACREAGVRLSVGYRLHFDPYHKEMMRLGQQQVFGEIDKIQTDNSMKIDKPEWRLDKSLAGGGPLINNGIYCVQAALYVTGELPVSVNAEYIPKTKPEFYSTVEEGIRWEMEFASGKKARCKTSYRENVDLLRVETEKEWFELQPSFDYSGLKGHTSHEKISFPSVNQQAAQMDDFALSIINQTESKVAGEMGLRDVEILMAIYESADTNKPVALDLTAYKILKEV